MVCAVAVGEVRSLTFSVPGGPQCWACGSTGRRVLALFEEMGADVYSQITRLWWLLAWRSGVLFCFLHDLTIVGRKVRGRHPLPKSVSLPFVLDQQNSPSHSGESENDQPI